MDFSSKTENGVRIVAVTGHLETSCVNEFRERFLEETEHDAKVILDCSGLEYLDSSGLATLISVFKALSARDTRLVLCGLSEGIFRVIQFTKLDNVLTVTDTCEQAFEKLRS